MAGAWYSLSAHGCHVITMAQPQSGSMGYNPHAPSGMMFGVAQWNQLSDQAWGGAYKVPCRSDCYGCVPAGGSPGGSPGGQPQAPSGGEQIPPSKPKSPVTGPGACEPAMSMRDDGARFGFDTDEHLSAPQGASFSGLDIGRPGGGSWYTTNPVVKKADGKISVYHPGHGSGYTVFHPSSLDARRHLWGDGVRRNGRWPMGIEQGTLLLLNGTGELGQRVNMRIGGGMPKDESASDTPLPRNGWYTEQSWPDGKPKLQVAFTDDDGEPRPDSGENAGRLCVSGDLHVHGDLTVDGSSPGGGGSGDISSSANLTTGIFPIATGVKQIDTTVPLRGAFDAGNARTTIGVTGATQKLRVSADAGDLELVSEGSASIIISADGNVAIDAPTSITHETLADDLLTLATTVPSADPVRHRHMQDRVETDTTDVVLFTLPTVADQCGGAEITVIVRAMESFKAVAEGDAIKFRISLVWQRIDDTTLIEWSRVTSDPTGNMTGGGGVVVAAGVNGTTKNVELTLTQNGSIPLLAHVYTDVEGPFGE